MKFFEYLSETNDRVTFRNVPIEHLEEMRKVIRGLKKHGFLPKNARIRYRFRGPRIGTDKRHTLKKHAVMFAVYVDEKR